MLDDLDTKSAVPLYEQIAVRLKAAVATGELRAGDALPSVRQLAVRLRINLATVTQAYRALEEDGFAGNRGREPAPSSRASPPTPAPANGSPRHAGSFARCSPTRPALDCPANS